MAARGQWAPSGHMPSDTCDLSSVYESLYSLSADATVANGSGGGGSSGVGVATPLAIVAIIAATCFV